MKTERGQSFKYPNSLFPWSFSNLQGVPKKMRLSVCFLSQQPSIGFLNSFFLLKTEILTQILNTKPFLYNFRGPRYLRNKMRFLTQVIVINSNFSDFCPSGILKHDKNEHKWKCFHPVWTIYDISGYLGGCQWHSGAIQGVSLGARGPYGVVRITTDKHRN